MSKPLIHAKSSAKRWGGDPFDYIEIHNLMDSTKSVSAEVSHRLIFHSAFGIFLVEKLFGPTITNADGKDVCVRDIAEQHVIEDLGFIPSLNKWLECIKPEPWMAGLNKVKMEIVD